ncbi:hypothetical protein ABZU45_32400 [Streptomyces avermitilis]|uniref:hypothetical protein n=1 Tax=Streptomyces avermitilis TaxID=33903 RepID=UPI0033B2B2E9
MARLPVRTHPPVRPAHHDIPFLFPLGGGPDIEVSLAEQMQQSMSAPKPGDAE